MRIRGRKEGDGMAKERMMMSIEIRIT